MLIEPDYNELLKKMNSKYRLCVVSAKRAMQIIENYAAAREGKQMVHPSPMIDFTGRTPLHMALEEIFKGYIKGKVETKEEKVEPEAAAEVEAEKLRKEIEEIFSSKSEEDSEE